MAAPNGSVWRMVPGGVAHLYWAGQRHSACGRLRLRPYREAYEVEIVKRPVAGQAVCRMCRALERMGEIFKTNQEEV